VPVRGERVCAKQSVPKLSGLRAPKQFLLRMFVNPEGQLFIFPRKNDTFESEAGLGNEILGACAASPDTFRAGPSPFRTAGSFGPTAAADRIRGHSGSRGADPAATTSHAPAVSNAAQQAHPSASPRRCSVPDDGEIGLCCEL
jgi:hypothetical protein